MNRRSFLATILTTACAPAIVRADSLMRIIPHSAWIGYASGDLIIVGKGRNSSYWSMTDGNDVLITETEAQQWLRKAAVRVVMQPADWLDDNGYTSPEVFHDGKWKSLCRTDLCDDVATGWVHNQSAERWRQHYLRKMHLGLRITDDRFSVIDTLTDG